MYNFDYSGALGGLLILGFLLAMVLGAVIGLLPLITGLIRKQKMFAWIGFGASIVGVFLGWWVSLLLSIGFFIIILVKPDLREVQPTAKPAEQPVAQPKVEEAVKEETTE